MTIQNNSTQLTKLKNKLKNARRRLRYWSGLSEFGEVYDADTTNKNPSDEYAKALADCRKIAHEIYEITGIKPEVKNLKAEYTPSVYEPQKPSDLHHNESSAADTKTRHLPPSVKALIEQYGPGQKLPRGKAWRALA